MNNLQPPKSKTAIPGEMRDLHPMVQQKAMEIYDRLKSENLMSDSIALMSSIQQAKSIFNENKLN